MQARVDKSLKDGIVYFTLSLCLFRGRFFHRSRDKKARSLQSAYLLLSFKFTRTFCEKSEELINLCAGVF